jgi:response regulator RpfG family c-di-GMP phosphodiesterase
MRTGKILVVDDDPDILETIRFSLEKEGHQVTAVEDGPAAAARLASEGYDLLLADLMMPGMTGSELVRQTLKRGPRLVCVIMTAYGSFKTAIKVMKEGAFDFIEKPLDLNALSLLVARALAHRQLLVENAALEQAVRIHQRSLPLSATLDLISAFDRVLDAASREVRAEDAYLLLWLQDRAEFVLCGARGVAAGTPPGAVLPGDACMGGEVVKTARPVLVGTGESWAGPKAAPLGEDRFVSSLLVPLGLEERIIGVLGIGSLDLDRSFSAADQEALAVLAGYAAVGIENARIHDDVKLRDLEVIIGFSHALVEREPWLRGRPERVAVLSKIVAREMGLDRRTCEEIYYGGLLSDLGKIGVPDSVLSESSAPGEVERTAIHRFPVIGKTIHTPSPDLGAIAEIVYTYHERYDGTGPEVLGGDAIPIGSRIVAAAVAFDAMTSGQSHLPATDLERALEALRERAGTLFDPAVVDAFVSALGNTRLSVSGDGRVKRS